mmetsp:Transcript_8581/g.21260  ORF Transcript_8581/g.21260 Transcript_8581/m.21260 type:complete len:202 (-) Transcript_8581:636-1241(-)
MAPAQPGRGLVPLLPPLPPEPATAAAARTQGSDARAPKGQCVAPFDPVRGLRGPGPLPAPEWQRRARRHPAQAAHRAEVGFRGAHFEGLGLQHHDRAEGDGAARSGGGRGKQRRQWRRDGGRGRGRREKGRGVGGARVLRVRRPKHPRAGFSHQAKEEERGQVPGLPREAPNQVKPRERGLHLFVSIQSLRRTVVIIFSLQ